MSRKAGDLRIGTSGWNYDGWKGTFYPEKISGGKMLATYAGTFKTVEVNGTFYKLPEPDTVRQWTETVPADFLFSVKASRYITHMKKLKDPEEGLRNLFRVLEPFGRKLGAVLVQCPPNWRVNLDRLEHFLKSLSSDYRYTFEFRDHSWLCEGVYTLLEKHHAALCIYDYEQYQSPERVTTDFVYLRLHGPEAQAYKGSYRDEVLREHARRCREWNRQGLTVYCYFDNDEKAHAPDDARRLRELTGNE
jgi:uncharacterized protein YecE (DUF72 family)